MSEINLPFGNNVFDSDELINYIRGTGRDYIIQGQVNCRRANHPKPNSLDCWLRDNYAQNPDTRQAVNEVVQLLVNTARYVEGRFSCPDSGKSCKGLRVIA